MGIPNNRTQWEWPADKTGIDGVNLKAASTYSSEFFDGRQYINLCAILTITETGSPTAGAASIVLDVYDHTKTVVLYSIDLATAIDTKTDGAICMVTFGPGVTASIAGDTGFTGTIGVDADMAKTIGWFKLKVRVDTQNDGTSSTGALVLVGERA